MKLSYETLLKGDNDQIQFGIHTSYYLYGVDGICELHNTTNETIGTGVYDSSFSVRFLLSIGLSFGLFLLVAV